ncbi:MAG TPA: hypothetical protein VGM19_00930 [Armatimonadota bacterium]|jgi:hypothetical protein
MTRSESRLVILVLLLIAAVAYAVDWHMFRRTDDMVFYSLLDVGFLALQVLLLTFIVERLLRERERHNRQQKMNMVIGTFFSAVGRPLLKLMGEMVVGGEAFFDRLRVDPDWTEAQLREAAKYVHGAEPQLEARAEQLAPLRDFLVEQREFLVRLLENPTLLEHEQFTDLLWAVSHLDEELAAREDLEHLGAADRQHLAGDALRAYSRLVSQWLAYMIHLRKRYPYLFSFAARTNPLRPGARAEIEG